VGVAQWAVQEDAGQPRPENLSFAPPVVWADDAQKEYAHALWDSYAAGRRKMVEQGEFPMICKVPFSTTSDTFEPFYERFRC
jgi:hypothetical protein